MPFAEQLKLLLPVLVFIVWIGLAVAEFWMSARSNSRDCLRYAVAILTLLWLIITTSSGDAFSAVTIVVATLLALTVRSAQKTDVPGIQLYWGGFGNGIQGIQIRPYFWLGLMCFAGFGFWLTLAWSTFESTRIDGAAPQSSSQNLTLTLTPNEEDIILGIREARRKRSERKRRTTPEPPVVPIANPAGQPSETTQPSTTEPTGQPAAGEATPDSASSEQGEDVPAGDSTCDAPARLTVFLRVESGQGSIAEVARGS